MAVANGETKGDAKHKIIEIPKVRINIHDKIKLIDDGSP
jgi:hypothetical protein